MTSFEMLNQLSWPAATAIVASVVTIVTGLFGYIVRQKPTVPPSPKSPVDACVEQVQVVHARVSEIRDRLSGIEGDSKVMIQRIESLQKQVDDHTVRNAKQVETDEHKIDKVMDILIKILSDDKL